MERPLRIRPHHLFCLLGFKGFGYSRAFVNNMRRISDMIKKGHEFRVNLVIGEDDICLFCPHLSNSNCLKKPDSEIVLQKKEQKIVSLLNVDTSDTVILSVLYEKMREKFTLNMLDNLCSDCQWYSMGDCKKGFKNLKKGGFL